MVNIPVWIDILMVLLSRDLTLDCWTSQIISVVPASHTIAHPPPVPWIGESVEPTIHPSSHTTHLQKGTYGVVKLRVPFKARSEKQFRIVPLPHSSTLLRTPVVELIPNDPPQVNIDLTHPATSHLSWTNTRVG